MCLLHQTRLGISHDSLKLSYGSKHGKEELNLREIL